MEVFFACAKALVFSGYKHPIFLGTVKVGKIERTNKFLQ